MMLASAQVICHVRRLAKSQKKRRTEGGRGNWGSSEGKKEKGRGGVGGRAKLGERFIESY